MRPAVVIFLAVLITGASCQAQVYSYGVYGGPMTIVRVDEHEWVTGSGANTYGLVQFRDRSGGETPFVTRTTIHLGPRQHTVRLSAIAIVGIAVLAAVSLAFFTFNVVGAVRDRMGRVSNNKYRAG